MPKSYTVIGSSAAGLSAIKNLRQIDSECQINLISADDLPSTNKCHWVDYALGHKSKEQLLICTPEFIKTFKVNYLEAKIIKLDPAANILFDSCSQTYKYENLIIACGLELNQIILPNCYNLASYADVENLQTVKHKNIASAVIVGAGLTGLEFSDVLKQYLSASSNNQLINLPEFGSKLDFSLQTVTQNPSISMTGALSDNLAKNYPVITLIDKHNIPLAQLLSDAAGQFIINKLAQNNINFSGNCKSIPPADIYLNATGGRPQSWLNILNNQNGYLLVDQYMCTNYPNIWAAGDCVMVPDKRTNQPVPSTLWPDAILQGAVAGQAAAGLQTKNYSGVMPICSSSFADVRFAVVSHKPLIGLDELKLQVQQNDEDYLELYTHNDRLMAYTSIGRCTQAALLKRLILTGESVSELKL
jgi:NADH dehydrogenase FAD-containing subunit